MRLADHLSPSRIVALTGATKQDVLAEIVGVAAEAEAVTDPDELRQAIFERERILSTGIGLGIAVPHAKIDSVTDFVIAMGVSRRGVDFEALDQQPANVVLLIAAPLGRQRDYLGLLAQVTMALKDEETRNRVIAAADDPDRILSILAG